MICWRLLLQFITGEAFLQIISEIKVIAVVNPTMISLFISIICFSNEEWNMKLDLIIWFCLEYLVAERNEKKKSKNQMTMAGYGSGYQIAFHFQYSIFYLTVKVDYIDMNNEINLAIIKFTFYSMTESFSFFD